MQIWSEVRLEFMAGTDIEQACREAMWISAEHNSCVVKFMFNGVNMDVVSYEDPNEYPSEEKIQAYVSEYRKKLETLKNRNIKNAIHEIQSLLGIAAVRSLTSTEVNRFEEMLSYLTN
jgi:poly(3-hydroxyalkanoate) synthetase